MREVDVAYAAGFFDGEGCVQTRQNNPRGGLQVTVSQITRVPLDWLRTLFGGNIHQRHSNKQFNGIFVWIVTGYQAVAFLEIILPYLMVRDGEASEAIERFHEGPPSPREVLS